MRLCVSTPSTANEHKQIGQTFSISIGSGESLRILSEKKFSSEKLMSFDRAAAPRKYRVSAQEIKTKTAHKTTRFTTPISSPYFPVNAEIRVSMPAVVHPATSTTVIIPKVCVCVNISANCLVLATVRNLYLDKVWL